MTKESTFPRSQRIKESVYGAFFASLAQEAVEDLLKTHQKNSKSLTSDYEWIVNRQTPDCHCSD